MSIRADILQARLGETLGGTLGQVAVGAAGQITLEVDAAAVVEVCTRCATRPIWPSIS